MKDFDIAKYLREHQLGSYGILNHYVDLKPLREEETAVAFKSGEKVKFNYDFEGDLEQASTNAGLQPEAGSALAYEHPDDVFDVIESDEKQTTVSFEGDEIVVPTKILVKATEIKEDAYKGPEHKLTGNGEGDEFEQAETVSEEDLTTEEDTSRLEGLINRQDLAAMQTSVQRIFDDLTDVGFVAEDVAEYLIDQIRRAAAPYIQ